MTSFTQYVYKAQDIQKCFLELEENFEELKNEDYSEYCKANIYIEEKLADYPRFNLMDSNIQKVSTLRLVDASMMLKWREKLNNFQVTLFGPAKTIDITEAMIQDVPTMTSFTTFTWGDTTVSMDDILASTTDIRVYDNCVEACFEVMHQGDDNPVKLPDNYPMDMWDQYDEKWFTHPGPDLFDFDADVNRFFNFMRDANFIQRKAIIEKRIKFGY